MEVRGPPKNPSQLPSPSSRPGLLGLCWPRRPSILEGASTADAVASACTRSPGCRSSMIWAWKSEKPSIRAGSPPVCSPPRASSPWEGAAHSLPLPPMSRIPPPPNCLPQGQHVMLCLFLQTLPFQSPTVQEVNKLTNSHPPSLLSLFDPVFPACTPPPLAGYVYTGGGAGGTLLLRNNSCMAAGMFAFL